MGASVLVAACRMRQLDAKVIYGTLSFAARIGFQTFQDISLNYARSHLGDHVFRPHAYGPDQAAGGLEPWRLPEEQRNLLAAAAPFAGDFLVELAEHILAHRPRIVGFSSSFQQSVATAGLARLIKAAAPDVVLVMGGANTMGPMGQALADAFPWIDHVFSGEADTAFPDFCEALLRDGIRPTSRVIACQPIYDFRKVAAPDFADYFAALRPLQAAGVLPQTLPEYLPMESSRGCWWGAKNHCTFCGLNGEGMEFRHKPPERMLAELKHLTAQWSPELFALTDNIMPQSYHKTLLPMLESWPERPRLFYEVKANLSSAQVGAMARAGIDRIQPGIESLSTKVLKLMHKGVSGPQNIALLRSGREVGMKVTWNYLYGFPGESIAEYEHLPELFRKLEHLQPPSGLHRLMIDRFSPYFNQAEEYGIGELTPLPGYRFLYPKDAAIFDIAYHFSGDYWTQLTQQRDLLARIHLAIVVWQRSWGTGQASAVLRMLDNDNGGFAVEDTRYIARERFTRISAAALDTIHRLNRPLARSSLPAALEREVEGLLDRDFIIEQDGLLLNLVCVPPPPEPQVI